MAISPHFRPAATPVRVTINRGLSRGSMMSSGILARVASHYGSWAMVLVDILVRTIFAVSDFVPAADLFSFCDPGQVVQVGVDL